MIGGQDVSLISVMLMAWENPIKTARICFYETGQIIEHYIPVDDADAIDRLVSFLRESKAVIVDLEDFTDDDVERLRSEKGRDGKSLFASADCFAKWDHNYRQRCAVVCPLKDGE